MYIIKIMNKEQQIKKIKNYLWTVRYSVNDMTKIHGIDFDLFVRVNKDSDIGYDLKVVSEKEDYVSELGSVLRRYKKKANAVPALAMVFGKKIVFAGGAQLKKGVPSFTSNHRDVFN